MASAGRILIIPKGNWNAETEYEMLDLVFNAGAAWLAKKNVVGIEPTEENTEYWMKMCEPIDLSTLNFSDGRGLLYATDDFTFLEAKQKGVGYRHIKIANPMNPSEVDDWLVLVDGDADSHTNYRVYGEHNKELLKTYVEQIIAEYLAKN